MEKLARLIWPVRWRLPPSRKVHVGAFVSSIYQESRSSSVSDWRCFGKEGILLLFYDATRGLAGDELTHLNIIQREPNL